MSSIYLPLYLYVCPCACVCVPACVSLCVRVCVSLCVCVHMCTHVCPCVPVRVVCVHVYVCVSLCMHVCVCAWACVAVWSVSHHTCNLVDINQKPSNLMAPAHRRHCPPRRAPGPDRPTPGLCWWHMPFLCKWFRLLQSQKCPEFIDKLHNHPT